jgi:hypothetical protein
VANPLSTFRDKGKDFQDFDFLTLEMGPIRCAETSVKDYHPTLRNMPEERRCHQHRGGSLKHGKKFSFGYREAFDGKVLSDFLEKCFQIFWKSAFRFFPSTCPFEKVRNFT